MKDNSWLQRRNRGFHVTIRDVDCRDFDVPRFIADLKSMHVTFFSFFVGGYVTTYPTALEYQRVSPYLDGRDLAGDIVREARAAGLKVLGMIDLGQVPENAARDHPDWCAQDIEGHLMERLPGLYATCPMGGYQSDYVSEIVAEILGRYDLDCVKFGGGSFGFTRDICYCPNCRADFKAATGRDLPLKHDWSHPLWPDYVAWKLNRARQRVHKLGEVVHSIDPSMPFMGNSVAFGDPGWTVGASLDLENQAAVADAVQVEIQTRARYDEAIGKAGWQWLSWPAETARYMTSVSDKPIWVVASYFLAWPWRRSAFPVAEQKVYLAQVAANGADPMVNLSGGPPAVHEDPRGFAAVRDLYGFLAEHQGYYEGDESAANVAFVYSHDTLFFYSKDDPTGRYVESIRGVEKALHAAHIPFDIISTRVLHDEAVLSRYKTLVLPSLACLSEEDADVLRKVAMQGGGIVATFETSLFDPLGAKRDDFLLANVFRAHYTATKSTMASDDAGYKQVYAVISTDSTEFNGKESVPSVESVKSVEKRHALLDGLEGTSVVPVGKDYAVVTAEADVPLRLGAPFVVFPEGYSYPMRPASGDPMAVVAESERGGRAVYFPGRPDALYWNVPYPDLGRLIANAVRWTAHDELPVRLEAPSTLQVSVRRQPGRVLVHLVNLTGERFFDETVPLHDVRVAIPADGLRVVRAFLLSTGETLRAQFDDNVLTVVVSKIVDYDVVVFEFRT